MMTSASPAKSSNVNGSLEIVTRQKSRKLGSAAAKSSSWWRMCGRAPRRKERKTARRRRARYQDGQPACTIQVRQTDAWKLAHRPNDQQSESSRAHGSRGNGKRRIFFKNGFENTA